MPARADALGLVKSETGPAGMPPGCRGLCCHCAVLVQSWERSRADLLNSGSVLEFFTSWPSTSDEDTSCHPVFGGEKLFGPDVCHRGQGFPRNRVLGPGRACGPSAFLVLSCSPAVWKEAPVRYWSSHLLRVLAWVARGVCDYGGKSKSNFSSEKFANGAEIPWWLWLWGNILIQEEEV